MGENLGVRRHDFLKGASATLAAIAGGELHSPTMLKRTSASYNLLVANPNRE